MWDFCPGTCSPPQRCEVIEKGLGLSLPVGQPFIGTLREEISLDLFECRRRWLGRLWPWRGFAFFGFLFLAFKQRAWNRLCRFISVRRYYFIIIIIIIVIIIMAFLGLLGFLWVFRKTQRTHWVFRYGLFPPSFLPVLPVSCHY